MMTLIDFAGVSLISLLGAVGILITLGSGRKRRNLLTPQPEKDVVLLYLDSALLDATQDAYDLLGRDMQCMTDLLDVLDSSFPALRATICETPGWTGRMVSTVYPVLWLDISILRGTMRIQLGGDLEPLAQHSDQKAQHAAVLMQDIRQFSPQLIWQQDCDGKVIWCNAAYRKHAGDECGAPFLDINTNMEGGLQKQQRVTKAGDDTQWFDVTTVARESHLLHFATDATALARADQDRQDFIQTFGKTFADLSIGLAIFDKERQLVMFNPALLEMTRLPVPFLSARPMIDTVLDRLRELQMMPEPKDYTTWREEFTAVEADAKKRDILGKLVAP